jgi:hypothetical protein
MEEQVVVIYAGVNGRSRPASGHKVRDFEQGCCLLASANAQGHSQTRSQDARSRDATRGKLKSVVESYAKCSRDRRS